MRFLEAEVYLREVELRRDHHCLRALPSVVRARLRRRPIMATAG